MHRSDDLVIRYLRLFAHAALSAYLGLFGLASAADAQQPASPQRIGVLLVTFSPESKEMQAFRQGLRDAGYAEGRDLVIESRHANATTLVYRSWCSIWSSAKSM